MPTPTWKIALCASTTTVVVRYLERTAYRVPVLLGQSYLAIFLQIFLIQFASCLTYYTIVRPHWLTPLRSLPQPKGGSFLFGHMKESFRLGTGECEANWVWHMAHDGLIYYRSIFNAERIIVTSPTGLSELCSRTYEFIKPKPVTNLAGKLLGIGLVLSERDQHKQQRRLFLPVFAPKHVRDMYPIFWNKSCESVIKMTDLTTEQNGPFQFEAGHWAARTALDVVTMATMGKDFGAIADENSPLARVYRNVFEPTRGFLVLAMMKSFFPAVLIDNLPVKWNRWQDEAVKTIRDICREMLRDKKQKLSEKSLHDKDLVSICIQYEEIAQASEEEVIDQMTTALAAGHETISVGITWAIYMLCLHPDWQSRLRDEVRAHFPSPDAFDTREGATAADVDQMPLMQAFLNETLRRYPPIPATMRHATQDTAIDGQFVPEGTRIVIPIKGINRDVRFWGPDAQEFRPERWIGPDGKISASGGVSSKYGSLTFMQGTRSCVAQGFAKAEMACIVGSWVGRFEFELMDENLRDEANMSISGGSFSGKPLYGLYVTAKVIPGW